MKNLVIVESPTKAKTLSSFLGKDYQIVASMGHVRDLPRGEFGVDVEHDFAPKYVIPKEKIKSVNSLVKEAAGANHLWLATDPDREGEAIAWNLLEIIGQKAKPKNQSYDRVVFHEITKDAVGEAFARPRKIDMDLVEAQQARRVLDRLVGYKLSPLLWKKVKSGLSAGRVQSVALRMVVDKEREIEAFKPSQYWIIEAVLVGQRPEIKDQQFTAALVKIRDKKAEVNNQKDAQKIVEELKKSAYKISQIVAKDTKKYPSPPFTTSTLQQSASTKFGFAPKKTMRIAQDLYEQGLITYMRTDSVNLAPQAVGETRKYIEEKFGSKYLPISPRQYKVKSRLAQEAHEAIRPTDISRTISNFQFPISNDHKKLYDLIWKRMVACQMSEAVVAETAIDIEATVKAESQGEKSIKTYQLRANGQKIKFDGWYRVFEKPPIKEQILPNLAENDDLDLKDIKSQQKFTEPPPRFTEATLIRELEKNDIGRPSTYAPTISTLYERVYIERVDGRKIAPTPIGKASVDFLVVNFPEVVDFSFTAAMEDDLDQIAQGRQEMAKTMEKFWQPFEKLVEKVEQEAQKVKVEVEETEEKCDKCGKVMVIRYGRFGKFLACSGFPECKNTKTLAEPTGLTCPNDGGNIVVKRTKRGKAFWGCENWPNCKFASWKKPATTESTDKDKSTLKESASPATTKNIESAA